MTREPSAGPDFDGPAFDGPEALLPAIAQDAASGRVLMLAYMNRQAYDETLRTGRAVYFSRSRGRLWRKGEESGHVQSVKRVLVDCDRDTILLEVEQTGGAACHLGYESCFFREVSDSGLSIIDEPVFDPAEAYEKATANQRNDLGTMSAEKKIIELKLELPPPPKAAGLYRPMTTLGNLVYTSGHGPMLPDGQLICGCVGRDLDVAAGKAAARQVGLTMLATLRHGLGSLDRISRLIKVFGLVACTPEFTDQPTVMNGFSELMHEVFGDEGGIASRSAVGAVALPAGMAIEVEAIFELKSE